MKSLALRSPAWGLSNRQFDNFFDDFFDSVRWPSAVVRQPLTDISYSDDGKAMRIDMEVPGYQPDDIQMSVENGVLEISGERSEKEEHKDKDRSYMVREMSRSFARRVVLPDGCDSDSIAAELDNGILKVTVPMAEKHAAKRIPIAAKKGKAKLASLTEAKPEDK
ncbi:hypothetical protein MAHJHV49_07010 [Mycobacterium avium subsp. hominissuis]|uniref:Hsp20/alpha crystallin family protein n=1 Tax=Mycobacterium avium TaxID=1764 RepID=UPI001CDAEDCC|nr:Hsp20/alpha crystallin family protein [Mycobacterium avium]MCA2293007.1 Hsp20/alpha crystallin family protein [Mycobacterium avium]